MNFINFPCRVPFENQVMPHRNMNFTLSWSPGTPYTSTVWVWSDGPRKRHGCLHIR